MRPLATEGEMRLVRDFLIIPVLLDYLDNDIKTAQTAGFKLDLLLIRGLKKVQDEIVKEHYVIKRTLRECGIRVQTERRTRYGIEAEYLCRGYKHQTSLLWDTIRTAVLTKASEYANIKLTSGDGG
ncbi:hypothetical protein ACFFK0_11830 [Paenibacillus chartarius]|uniref:Uncharacterized protein n=1 Tax=Paenibacillus chartarius TaxID=747481 RepID=A0ABV6DKF0_9BACL